MNKIKELIKKFEAIDSPPPTETFKQNNPAYLKWLDSDCGRADIGPIDELKQIWKEFTR